jgi:hypothetical protein
MNLLTNCCGAEINEDNDLCATCGEHCGAVDENELGYTFEVNRWIPTIPEIEKVERGWADRVMNHIVYGDSPFTNRAEEDLEAEAVKHEENERMWNKVRD